MILAWRLLEKLKLNDFFNVALEITWNKFKEYNNNKTKLK